MDTSIALLQEKVASLSAIVENLVARAPSAYPPPPQIVQVSNGAGSGMGSAGTLLDWTGSGYQGDMNLAPLSFYQAAGLWLIWRPQSQRWEELTSASGTAFGTLNGALSGSGSAYFTFTIGGSGSALCYDGGLLCPGSGSSSGDSLSSGTVVVNAQINGKWYVIQARCGC